MGLFGCTQLTLSSQAPVLANAKLLASGKIMPLPRGDVGNSGVRKKHSSLNPRSESLPAGMALLCSSVLAPALGSLRWGPVPRATRVGGGRDGAQHICQRPSCPVRSREGVTLHSDGHAAEPSPPRAPGSKSHQGGECAEGHVLVGNGATALPGLQTPSVGPSVHLSSCWLLQRKPRCPFLQGSPLCWGAGDSCTFPAFVHTLQRTGCSGSGHDTLPITELPPSP